MRQLRRRLRRCLVPVTALAVLLTSASATQAAAAPSDSLAQAAAPPTATVPLEGIDVSNWQGTIDWTKVRAAGKQFAIIKATEGTTFIDPYYAANHANARAAGVWTTAYHFAQPTAVTGTANPDLNDAVAEANHFVAVAKLQSGDLIPALDLEVTGGLGPTALVAWVNAWLVQVTARLGVRPMIYVSPSFWSNRMANTAWFALNGYRILWIAHWGVTSPTVPAGNWGGHGWTFWQYSNCGTVPGISGCVDLDRYNGTDLAPVAYSVFSLSMPAALSVKQGQAAAATISIPRINFPGGIALTVTGLPAGVTASLGSNPASGTSTSLTIRAAGLPTPATIGAYPLTITATGTAPSGSLTRTVATTLRVTDGIAPVVRGPTSGFYTGAVVGAAVPVQQRWSATDAVGVRANWLQRQVGGGSWAGVALPTATAAAINQPLATATTYRYRAQAVDGNTNYSPMSYGRSLRVTLSQEGAASYRGAWSGASSSVFSGGAERWSGSAGASATFTISGSSIAWVAVRGPGRGSAQVWLDGVYAGTVSMWAPTYRYRTVVFAHNWGWNSTHTIRIVVLGTPGHPRVDVDGFARMYLY